MSLVGLNMGLMGGEGRAKVQQRWVGEGVTKIGGFRDMVR